MNFRDSNIRAVRGSGVTMPTAGLDPAADAEIGRLSVRQLEILRLVRAQGRMSVAALAARLEVSEETVRRDLRPLAADGLVLKTHGAVVLPDPLTEPPLKRRMLENVEAKARIARAAAAEIEDGDSVMLDTGSTTIFVARELSARRGLTTITNSTEAARILAAAESARVFLAGGELRADDGAIFGPQALALVAQFVARTAILSIGGVDATHGFTDFDVREAEFSQALMERVERVIVVADHSKFHRRGFARVCGFDRIDMLITDAPPPPDMAAKLAEGRVRVTVVA
jgi:DeoR family glycerol-3-phosphate regulon repressor